MVRSGELPIHRASVPGKPLDGIQAGGKCPGGVSDPVTIGIDQHDDRVAGRPAGIPASRSLPDEQTAAGVERHGAGIPHHGLAGKEFHLQLGRNGRKRGDGGRLTDEPVAPRAATSKAARREPARTISDPLRFRDPAFPRSGACVMEWLVFRGRPIGETQ